MTAPEAPTDTMLEGLSASPSSEPPSAPKKNRMTSHADPAKRRAMEQLMTLLRGALEARGKVLLKVNVTAEHRDAVLAVLPSAKSPTVNQLANGDYAIESVVPKAGINLVIPALTEAGATDLLEIPISKIVH